MPQYGKEIQYVIDQLSPDDEKLLGDFYCGNEEINTFIKATRKEKTNHVTYLYKNIESGEVIGFASISCSGIRREIGKYSETIPAIEICYFAVVNELHKLVYDESDKHFYLSDAMLIDLIARCRIITERYVGADYLILYSVPDAVHFYRRNLFSDFGEFMVSDNRVYLEGCTPMMMWL